MGKILAALSHKGGTGRSVTSANVAYHLAKTGLDVCIVDLDLASPTLGAILGLDDIAAGVEKPGEPGSPRSIADLIHKPNDVTYVVNALRDAWSGSNFDDINPPPDWGRFQLLPGSKQSGDATAGKLEVMMPDLISALRDRFDIVYLDLRSGASELVEVFRAASKNTETHAVDTWLVHFRWTKQHLIGLGDIIEMLAGISPERQYLIRTAFVDPETVQPQSRQAFVGGQHDMLDNQIRDLNIGEGRALDSLLETIPMEPLLQWRESIILNRNVETGLANAETYQAFSNLSDKIIELLDQ